ncbi:MAG: hypothetical protein J6B82_05485 [Bacteroidaceae bacterium]|nr:hypothetical protein [Bacteroidaceae bacterium]
MKIETTIKYYEGYIPPRCRKMRYREVMEHVWNEVSECTLSDVELAFKVKGRPIYAYKGQIYKEEELHSCVKDRFESALDKLIRGGNIYSTYFARTKDIKRKDYWAADNQENREDVMKRLEDDLSRYLVIDGVLYKQTPVPVYRLITFGCLGDGVSLYVEYYQYPPEAIVGMRGIYFSALDYEEASRTADEVAVSQGNPEQVGTFEKLIEVYKPEFVEPVLN